MTKLEKYALSNLSETIEKVATKARHAKNNLKPDAKNLQENVDDILVLIMEAQHLVDMVIEANE